MLSAKLCMLAPAGDAHHAGRKLIESYERGVAYQLAEALQAALHKKYGTKVVLNRSPREAVAPLQNASFANRLGVDCFISLHLYREESAKPKIYLYHLLNNKLVDGASTLLDKLSFIPVHQAHHSSVSITKKWISQLHDGLKHKSYRRLLDCEQPLGIPFKPLMGITAPAIAIEIGLCQENRWRSLIEPLVASLSFLGES